MMRARVMGPVAIGTGLALLGIVISLMHSEPRFAGLALLFLGLFVTLIAIPGMVRNLPPFDDHTLDGSPDDQHYPE
jgi:hypothetical protein